MPVAVGLRGLLLRQWRHRDAGSAVAQVDHNAATVLFELFQHRFHVFRAGEDIPDDVGLVEARQHILAVADAVIDKSDVGDRIERRAVGKALHRSDRTVGGEGRDALDQLLACLTVGDHVGNRDMLELMGFGELRHLRALHHRAIVIHQLADDADRRQAA